MMTNKSYQHINMAMPPCVKKAEGKRENSPTPPYREKGRVKKSSPGYIHNPLSPRGRAYACKSQTERYQLAGNAAAEIGRILDIKPSQRDYRLWAFYCYHYDISIIIDKAYEFASCQRQHEIKNAVTAFQHWLSTTFAKGGAI